MKSIIALALICFVCISGTITMTAAVAAQQETMPTTEIIIEDTTEPSHPFTQPVAPQEFTIPTNNFETPTKSTEPTKPTEPIEATEPTETLPQYKMISIGNFKLTAYCPCYECSGHWGTQTSTGTTAIADHTVAVDPKVIPYGTKLFIH